MYRTARGPRVRITQEAAHGRPPRECGVQDYARSTGSNHAGGVSDVSGRIGGVSGRIGDRIGQSNILKYSDMPPGVPDMYRGRIGHVPVPDTYQIRVRLLIRSIRVT